MHKGNINFKEIRKKVINQPSFENDENIALNPTYKISFRGIKRQQDPSIVLINTHQNDIPAFSPMRINTTKSKAHDTSRE